MSSDAGSSMPGLVRYHSLATRTYSPVGLGGGVAGSTTIAPYLNDSPGATSRKATFGAIRAAWSRSNSPNQ
jgi:hypothetical protein